MMYLFAIYFHSLRITFKPDFSCQQMRHAMKHTARGKPCVPHMGIFLSDLTMMDEIPTYVDVTTTSGGGGGGSGGGGGGSGRHINFFKCRKVSGLIERIAMYQEIEYGLIWLPSLALHVTELTGTLKRLESFALSKKYEPG